jgi:hypothetical protein
MVGWQPDVLTLNAGQSENQPEDATYWSSPGMARDCGPSVSTAEDMACLWAETAPPGSFKLSTARCFFGFTIRVGVRGTLLGALRTQNLG